MGGPDPASQQPFFGGGTSPSGGAPSPTFAPHDGPFAPNCSLRVGHSCCSQTSCSAAPAGQVSGPASSTNRHTFCQLVASGDCATALKSGSQFAPQPYSMPFGLWPRHASCGGVGIGEKLAPALVDWNEPPSWVATSTCCASRTTTPVI